MLEKYFFISFQKSVLHEEVYEMFPTDKRKILLLKQLYIKDLLFSLVGKFILYQHNSTNSFEIWSLPTNIVLISYNMAKAQIVYHLLIGGYMFTWLWTNTTKRICDSHIATVQTCGTSNLHEIVDSTFLTL